jgi:hypothetical protein
MSEPVQERPVPPSLMSRVVGIITSPRATFERIVAAPRVGGVLMLVTLITTLAVGLLLSTERGQQGWLDQAVAQQEAFGQTVSDQAYAQMEAMSKYAAYMGASQFIVGVPLGVLITAGLLFALYNALMGGTATFKQVMAVVAHSQVISALAFLVTTPINYAKGTMTGATNLGVLFPMLDESSFAARLLGMMDLFLLWWLFVLSIGVGVLYKRKTSSVAMVLFGIYAVIALGLAAFMASRSVS